MFHPAIALLGCDTDISMSRIPSIMVPTEKPKTQFVKDLKDGDEVDSLFSVKFKKPPRQYAKGIMFEVRIADRTGEISVKYWGGKAETEVRKAYEAFDS